VMSYMIDHEAFTKLPSERNLTFRVANNIIAFSLSRDNAHYILCAYWVFCCFKFRRIHVHGMASTPIRAIYRKTRENSNICDHGTCNYMDVHLQNNILFDSQQSSPPNTYTHGPGQISTWTTKNCS
jgi:hypothetical protein